MAPNDATEVVPYLTSSMTIFILQQWMKRAEWYARFVQAFPGAGKYGHWIMAAAMSLVAALGIHWVWTGSLQDFLKGTGGSITITIPALGVLLHGFSDWYKVYILQHGMYLMSKPPAYVPPAQGAKP